MKSHKIVNGLDPTNDYDYATKKYVDDNAGGTIDSGSFYTSGQADATFVPISGNTTIAGHKTFASGIRIGNFTLTYNSTLNRLDFNYVA